MNLLLSKDRSNLHRISHGRAVSVGSIPRETLFSSDLPRSLRIDKEQLYSREGWERDPPKHAICTRCSDVQASIRENPSPNLQIGPFIGRDNEASEMAPHCQAGQIKAPPARDAHMTSNHAQ